MKKIMVLGLAAMLVFSATVLFAAKDKGKGASAQAQEHADDNAIFNRVGDWFATAGKSDEEKATIKAQRRAERKVKRAEKEAKKKAKEAKEKMKKGKKNLDKKMEKGKKNLDKRMKKNR
ncbi:MAG: hypothetical protein KAR32_03635 [Candidatus Omnitrophica bacterium]|nr:hypothetical protein [Candidatus Omnitrophota bacterium]